MPKLVWRVKLLAELEPGVTTETEVARIERGGEAGQLGREAAVALLRGSVLSWIAFASCFLAIGLALEAQGLAVAFALGVLAAAATTVLVLWTDRRVASGFSFENRA